MGCTEDEFVDKFFFSSLVSGKTGRARAGGRRRLCRLTSTSGAKPANGAMCARRISARAWVSRPALIHRRVRSTLRVSETKNKSKMWKAVRRFSPLRAGSALCRSGAPCHHSAHQLEPGQETVWVTTLGGEWSNVDVNLYNVCERITADFHSC